MPSKYENFISMIAFLQLLDGMTWNGVMIIKNLWEHKCKRKSYIPRWNRIQEINLGK